MKNEFASKVKFGVVVILCALTMASLAWGQNGSTTNFAMMGLTRGQTLQINIVAFPPNPCYAQLGFQDSNGNAIGSTKTVSLSAGQSASLTINGNSLTSQQDHRIEVLPTVVVNPNQPSSQCAASAEIFANSSGVASVFVPGSVGFPPNPAFGMVGVTSVQTVRLNVVAFPPNPCTGTLSFFNSKGVQVGDALDIQLTVGQATFLDLPGSTLVTKSGARAEVRPVVTVSGGSCAASAEVYSNSLETTAVFFPPVPCSPSSTSCFVF